MFVEKSYFVVELQIIHANPALLAQSVADQDGGGDDDDSVESSVLQEWVEKQEEEELEQATSPYVVTSRLDSMVQNNNPLSRRSCPARWIDWVLSKISAHHRRRLESRVLPTLIQSQITKKMDEMLQKKMIEKNVVAQTEVLPESQQARYFFDHLKTVKVQK